MIISFGKDEMLFQLHNRESGRFYEDISRDKCVSKHRKEVRYIRSCYDHGPAFNLCKKIKKRKRSDPFEEISMYRNTDKSKTGMHILYHIKNRHHELRVFVMFVNALFKNKTFCL